MSTQHPHRPLGRRSLAVALVSTLGVALALLARLTPPTSPARVASPPPAPAALAAPAPARLPAVPAPASSSPVTPGWQATVQRRIAAAEYAFRPAGDGYRAANRAHGLVARFEGGGVTLGARTGGGDVRLATAAVGRPGHLRDVRAATLAEGECPDATRVDERGGCLRRLEQRRADVVEWWANGTDGLEQGYTLAARPAGDGPLQLRLDVDGADVTVEQGGASATLSRHGGGALRYADLRAVDADGRELEATLLASREGLVVQVDDGGARYPVTIDPLVTTVAWSAEGNQANAWFGQSVAGAGDVNNDGYSDVIVGAKLYDNGETDEGRAFLFLGGASGLSTTASWTAEGNQVGAWFGQSVASAGDVNNDGYSDVIVGASAFSNGEAGEGRAYVYLGGASGLSPTAAWTAESNQSGASFGATVAGAGDVNNDGYADVIVGAQAYDNGQLDEGRAYVYLGGASGLASTAAWTAESNQSIAAFGFSVAGAGDVNADGYADVIVGAFQYGNGQIGEGRAWVYLGGVSGPSTTASWTVEGNQTDAHFGASVAGAGDVNGDGYADVIVGATGYDNGQTDEGRAFVYFGAASGLATSAAWTVESDLADGGLGGVVASAGDVNGDGYADVLVGVPGVRVQVHLGNVTGLSATAVATLTGGSFFGSAAASAGDVNGDGYGDVIVGAFSYSDGEAGEGRATLYVGSAAGPASSAVWGVESDQATARLGYSVAGAGDVNGDGYADVVVGAPYFDAGEDDEGRALLYLGTAAGLDTTAAWVMESNQAGAEMGYSVAGAGDVNGDGYADVIVGVHYASNGQSTEGRAFVYHGSSAGLGTTAAWAGESNQTAAYYGQSVAGAGDVNGDGFADVIVGAYQYDNGQDGEGRAFVYLGSATGLATAAAWTAESDQVAAGYGESVASAGDVNGDGYGDVIVGASSYERDGTVADEGAAFLYLGGPPGPAASHAWRATGESAGAREGVSAAGAGDVNGDGYADVIVGSFRYTTGGVQQGRARVFLGSGAGVQSAAAWTALGGQAACSFGFSVAGAGDVNGDGYGDVIVGAYQYDNGQTDEGRAFVYLGAAGGLGTTAAWTAESDAAGAGFGRSVAGVGDANGDGYADLVVGAYHYSNGQSLEGRTYLFPGNGGDGVGGGTALRLQAERVGTSTPVVPGVTAASPSAINFHVRSAYSPMGRTQSRLEAEVQPLGAPFNGTNRVPGPYGNTTNIGEERRTGLAADTAYHWRARLLYQPSRSGTWLRSRWLYGGFSGDARGVHFRTSPCAAGTAGSSCQYADATTCNGHGAASATGSCACAAGYDGARCNACGAGYVGYPSCTPCTASVTCSGHGTCTTAGACVCATGYTGPSCNACATDYYGYPACTSCVAATTCNAHGTCTAGGGCACAAGYAGGGCQYGDATTCSGHGAAQADGSCVCATGYVGAACQFSGSSTCSGHGTVSAGGACTCANGFQGATCNACAADYYGYPTCAFCTAAATCGGHGSCNALGACNCATGYAGSGCQYSNAATCSGHGTATAAGGCLCAPGYTRERCDALCSAGSYCTGGTAEALPCGAGTYSLPGASSCSACACDDGDACTADVCVVTSGACTRTQICLDAGDSDAGDAGDAGDVSDAVDAVGDAALSDAGDVAIDAEDAIDVAGGDGGTTDVVVDDAAVDVGAAAQDAALDAVDSEIADVAATDLATDAGGSDGASSSDGDRADVDDAVMPPGGSGDGCGCTVAGTGGHDRRGVALLIALAAGLALRRRRNAQRSRGDAP